MIMNNLKKRFEVLTQRVNGPLHSSLPGHSQKTPSQSSEKNTSLCLIDRTIKAIIDKAFQFKGIVNTI
jgi:hypothetical protein